MSSLCADEWCSFIARARRSDLLEVRRFTSVNGGNISSEAKDALMVEAVADDAPLPLLGCCGTYFKLSPPSFMLSLSSNGGIDDDAGEVFVLLDADEQPKRVTSPMSSLSLLRRLLNTSSMVIRHCFHWM